MLLALTRPVSTSIAGCALTYKERVPIDLNRARAQHADYEALLRALGARVLPLPAAPHLPDAVFVEDTAVVLDEIAVMTSPRLPSRREEVADVANILALHRAVSTIVEPAYLEGGDVIHIDRRLYVGISQRTNRDGAESLARILKPYGYKVISVPVFGCLHLKTACTYIGRDTILINPSFVDPTIFQDMNVVHVDPDEPDAGNALPVGDALIFPASFPRTRSILERRGFHLEPVDVSELQMAEAGVTCCSILFDVQSGRLRSDRDRLDLDEPG